METDVVCPDCGKVIAPAGAVEDILRCRCAEAPKGPTVTPDVVSTKPKLSVKLAVPAGENAALLRSRGGNGSINYTAEPSSDDSAAGASNDSSSSSLTGSTVTTEKKEKKCYVCSKSLEGRTRLKDHLGRYWCKECSEADARSKKHEEETRCADCSRVFPPHKLMYFQTSRVCATCFKQREKALEKKIKKAAAEKTYTAQEWRQIKIMAIIAAVLLGLGAMGWLMS